MEKRVLFIDLNDGHIFLDSVHNINYWGRREFRKGATNITHPAGIYNTYCNHMKALQLTELISLSLPWRNCSLKFDMSAEAGIEDYYTFDHCHKDARLLILYFKKSEPEFINSFDGRRKEYKVISKSISFLEDEQSGGLMISKVGPISLECIKNDLRKMGVKLHCDPVKCDIPKSEADNIYRSLVSSYCGGFTNPEPFAVVKIAEEKAKEKKETKTMDYIDNFWKYHSIKIYNDRLELLDDLNKNNVNIVRIQDPKSKEIIEKNRDLFILFLKDISDEALFGRHLQLIFIPKEHKTILKSDIKQSVIVDHDGKGKFDYLLAKELIFCKYRNKGKYDWYDKLTQHRKIKEV